MQEKDVTLVIPARNAARTVEACLKSVTPLLEQSRLKEIVFVDDGSTDNTAELAKRFNIRYVKSVGAGPASARNLGWRAATTPLVWFIDSDCVAEPDALAILLDHMKDEQVAGVGGSYKNIYPDSLLACLIHEEIAERHGAMPSEVNFLASFNVLYRRERLEQIGGFDEQYIVPAAEDADLAFRIRERQGRLKFDPRSVVEHFHPTAFPSYLRTQRRHGYWRVWLYLKHPKKMGGDSYSGLIDHIQPPLALLSLALLPFGPPALAAGAAVLALGAAQLPMTARLVRRTRDPRYLLYAPMGFIRAYARGIGMSQGAIEILLTRIREIRS